MHFLHTGNLEEVQAVTIYVQHIARVYILPIFFAEYDHTLVVGVYESRDVDWIHDMLLVGLEIGPLFSHRRLGDL